MEEFWGFFWLMVVLKIPIAALLWIVWWAIRAEPVPETGPGDSGGSDRARPHPRGRPPRPPRRGPHAEPPPRQPERIRVAQARARVPAGHR